MQGQAALTLGLWALGGLLCLRKERSVILEPSCTPKQAPLPLKGAGVDPTPSNGSLAQSWGLLVLALLADLPLAFVLYTTIKDDAGWRKSKVWLNILAAALPALASTIYVALYSRGSESKEQAEASNQRLVPNPQTVQNMTGTWVKDSKASDSMAEAIELAQLNRLTRTAVKLIKGVQILQTEEDFEFAVFSVIGWFKVKESYAMNGSPHQEKRRDLRKGMHTGWISIVKNGHVRLSLIWDDPHGGRGYDEFRLMSENELQVVSQIEVGGRTAGYTIVYRRKL